MHRASHRPGVVLLEVLIALAILGATGGAVAAMATQSADAVRRAHRNDDEVRRASNFLESVALWTREDLDRHLGDHGQGTWRLEVQHPAATLYTVRLTDSTGSVSLLHTALHRPEPATIWSERHAR